MSWRITGTGVAVGMTVAVDGTGVEEASGTGVLAGSLLELQAMASEVSGNTSASATRLEPRRNQRRGVIQLRV